MSTSSSSPHFYTRGYLPHVDIVGATYMVTFCLADGVPSAVIDRWHVQLRHLDARRRGIELRRRGEAYLDTGDGKCCLCRPEIGQLVQSALQFFDGERYDLHAWVIMPNHVHALLELLAEYRLREVLHSWKSYSAKQANRLLGQKGRFWQREYFDTLIRDDRHFETAARYIEGNPVKAGLCVVAEEWPFSSAFGREED